MTAAEGGHPLERWLREVADGVAETSAALGADPASGSRTEVAADAFDEDPWIDVRIETVVLSVEQHGFLTAFQDLPDIKGERLWSDGYTHSDVAPPDVAGEHPWDDLPDENEDEDRREDR